MQTKKNPLSRLQLALSRRVLRRRPQIRRYRYMIRREGVDQHHVERPLRGMSAEQPTPNKRVMA